MCSGMAYLCQTMGDGGYIIMYIITNCSLCCFVIPVVSAITIIHKVLSSSRNALRSCNDNTAQNRSVSSRKSQASSLTAMLLLTSTTYFICTTPFCIFVIYTNAFGSELDYAVDDLIWASVNMLQFTNNCINFILYCVSGKRFRDELRG